MYVYKKQCDEDYYLSIIQFTQQQYQNNFQYQFQNNYVPGFPINYNMYNQPNYFPNFNEINNNYSYKTPEKKKKLKIYKYFNDSNDSSPSSSSIINFKNKTFANEKFILNTISKNENKALNDKGLMNYDYGKNTNDFINKKIFKLEDFLTEKK